MLDPPNKRPKGAMRTAAAADVRPWRPTPQLAEAMDRVDPEAKHVAIRPRKGGTMTDILYVRAAADPRFRDAAPDGSIQHPYWRITDAIGRARDLYDSSPTGPRHVPRAITIDIGPGTYIGAYTPDKLHPDWERLPLWIDIPGVEVRGSTRIALSALKGTVVRGLTGRLVLEDATTLTVGSALQNTLKVNGQPYTQAIMAVGPTTSHPGNVHDVAIRNLHFDGVFGADGQTTGLGGTGLFVDRVVEASVEGNVFERLLAGTRWRASSGQWSHNYAFANGNAGAVLSGGSSAHPSVLTIENDTCVGNTLVGLLLNAQAAYLLRLDPGRSGLLSDEVQTVFDPDSVADAANIPNSLVATVNRGEYSGNGWVGLRAWAVGMRPNTYNVTPGRMMASRLDVDIRSAVFAFNGPDLLSAEIGPPPGTYAPTTPSLTAATTGYGIALDAGFPERTVDKVAQPIYTGLYSLNVMNCTLRGNHSAQVFLGFTRLDEGVTPRFKPLRNSTIQVHGLPRDGDKHWLFPRVPMSKIDNPELDPDDPTLAAVPLYNQLLIS